MSYYVNYTISISSDPFGIQSAHEFVLHVQISAALPYC